MTPDTHIRRPAWFIILLVVLSLPLLATPAYLAHIPEDNGIFLCFPLYVLLSVYLAYASWPQRRYIAWILIGVLILSYISLLFIL